MSGDLTAAVEAGARAVHKSWCFGSGHDGGADDYRRAEVVLAAASPLIAAQVAEQIAAAIEAEAGDCTCDSCDERRAVLADAARIAREWSPR